MSNLGKSLVALVSVATASAGLAASAVGAEPLKLELIAYLDRPGGRQIVEEKYYEAIDLAETQVASRKALHRLVAYTNLCVAYTMVGNFTTAKDACEVALDLAKQEDRSTRPSRGNWPMPTVARALSNRGVVEVMLGDTSAAMEDFAAADALDPSTWKAPKRNMAYVAELEAAVAVAQSRE